MPFHFNSLAPRIALLAIASLLTSGSALADSLRILPQGSGADAEQTATRAVALDDEDLELGYLQGRRLVGLRYKLNVPSGATISDARIQFKALSASNSPAKVFIKAESAAKPAPFSATTNDLLKRTRTKAGQSWTIPAWKYAGHRNADQLTPNIAPVVQEIVNRPDWKAGNEIVLIVDTEKGNGSRRAYSVDGNAKNAPELQLQFTSVPGNDRGQRIIIDSDFGFDVDDAGALAVGHALADAGEARILATMTVVTDPYSAGAMDAINTYYGRGNILVGQNKVGHASWSTALPYWTKMKAHYIRLLDTQFPHDTTTANVMDATLAYRKVLAAQPDGSVNIAVLGFLDNMSDLLQSKPDIYSPLSGKELVKRKVGELVIMGGSNGGNDFNLTGAKANDPTAAAYVLANWPGKISLQNGRVCSKVLSGATLGDNPANPVAMAYKAFHGRVGARRASWDQCVVVQAVRGLGSTLSVMPNRSFTLQGRTGRESTDSIANQRIIARSVSTDAMSTLINQLMDKRPLYGK